VDNYLEVLRQSGKDFAQHKKGKKRLT